MRDLANIPDPETNEIVRELYSLRQRFNDGSDYRPLVSSIKYFETSLVQQKRSLKIESNMSEYIRDIAKLAALKDVMNFQIESWEKIRQLSQSNEKASLIVSAETGMGKTEAVIPAILNEVINSDSLAILVFPRKALLKDQLQRIAKYNSNYLNQGSIAASVSPLRIAIQMGGISEKLYWTAYSDPNKDEVVQRGYEIESDFLLAKYVSDDLDELHLLDIKCPICDENLRWNFKFKRGVRGYGRDSRNVQANNFVGYQGANYYWQCPNHNHVRYTISFSREDHLQVKPNIIFTTIDSLESLLFDPEFGKYIAERTKYVVLDEVHIYNGIYGAHASAIIEELTKRLRQKPIFVGLSATITDPETFSTRLFNTDIDHNNTILPSEADKNQDAESPKRRFIFLKSRFHETRYYPMLTQVMIQSALLFSSSIASTSNQLLAFMDSIDAVTRLRNQTMDAYNDLGLHTLRLDDLTEKVATFDTHSCSRFAPYGCSNGCYVYEHGECWALTRHRSGLASSPSRIDIVGVTANTPQSRTALMEQALIYSTSELELGVDLPFVTNLFQYGSPYSVTNFIQRVGRAGRRTGTKPLIVLALGEKTSDYIYYRKGSDILNDPLSTSLNNENNVIKFLHEELGKMAGLAIREIKHDTRNIRDYVKEIVDTWETVISRSGAAFQREMDDLRIQDLLLVRSRWDDIKIFKRNIDEILYNKTTELKNRLRHDLLGDEKDPRDELREKSIELQEKVSGLGLDTSRFLRKINDFLAEYNVPPEQRRVKDRLQELKKESEDLLAEVTANIRGRGNVRVTDVLQPFMRIFSLIEKIAEKTEITTDEVRKLFYRIQFFSELKDAFSKSSLVEIIKGASRARYFLEVSEDFFGQDTIYPFPSNFFRLSRFFCISKERRSNDTEKISIEDALSKYFPFRVNSNAGNNFGEVVLPEVRTVNGQLVFSLGSYMDYILLRDQNEFLYAFPRIVTFERYQTEPLYGLLKYCDHCHRFYSFRWQGNCASCNGHLQDTRVYSSPDLESSIRSNEWEKKTTQTSISRNATLIRTLRGVSISLTPALRRENRYILASKRTVDFEIAAEIPYGYSIKTWALKTSVKEKTIEEMVQAYSNEFPALSANKGTELLESIALHTISHLWVLMSAEYSQIAGDDFSYDWETGDNGYCVKISEDQEGGAGFIEGVGHILETSPRRVYDSLISIISCEEHNSISSSPGTRYGNVNSKSIYDWIRTVLPTGRALSDRQEIMNLYSDANNYTIDEVMNEYPTCVDGCSNCITITDCRESGAEQLDYVSLTMARAYLNSISKIERDKNAVADLVKQGWRIIDVIDEGEGGYLVLDI